MKISRKIAGVIIGSAAFVMVFSACSLADGMVRSYLTGKEVPESVGRNRPVAIMFNNIQDAIPQFGISNSDVTVEAEVEGLITRIMGIIEDYQNIGRIGSVRSARNYYYYFAREFQATYMHFGEAVYCVPLLMLDSTWELSGLSDYGEMVYYRSDDRVSPHNVFTNYDMIQAGIDHLKLPKKYPDAYQGHFQFMGDGEEFKASNGIVANVVLPGYSYNHARFDYNPDDGLYYRSQYDAPHIDGDNDKQLSCKNIILQYCDSDPFDENGYLWTDCVTGGTGKYITNGRCIDITWKKPYAQEETTFMMDIESQLLKVPVYTGDFEVTHYYDMDGNEIKLNQGKTWICLVRNSAADKVVITDNRSVSNDVTDHIS